MRSRIGRRGGQVRPNLRDLLRDCRDCLERMRAPPWAVAYWVAIMGGLAFLLWKRHPLLALLVLLTKGGVILLVVLGALFQTVREWRVKRAVGSSRN